MWLFGKKEINIYSPVDGKVVDKLTIADETFSKDLMGPTIGILPSNGTFVAPIDGIVTMIADTGHAYSVKGKTGIEVLIHIGIDTVVLNARRKASSSLVAFKPLVKQGDDVILGQPIMEVKLKDIEKAKLSPITPVVIINETLDGKHCTFVEIGSEVAKATPICSIK